MCHTKSIEQLFSLKCVCMYRFLFVFLLDNISALRVEEKDQNTIWTTIVEEGSLSAITSNNVTISVETDRIRILNIGFNKKLKLCEVEIYGGNLLLFFYEHSKVRNGSNINI